MITTKYYLDCRAAARNAPAPLKISITKKGRTALFAVNVRLLPNQWDKSKCKVINHPQRIALNNYLAKKLLDVNALLEQMELQGELVNLTATQIKNLVTRKLDGGDDLDSTFLAHLRQFGDSRPKQRTRELYAATLSRIKAFERNAESLRFVDITPEWLFRFDKFLSRTSPARNARNIHMRNIRAVFNAAIDDDITTYYPFRKYKIKPEPTRSRALSVEMLRYIFNYKCEPHQQKYIDLFKLIFFLIGINTIDLYNAVSLDGDRLNYIRSKTSRLYSIKVEPEAMEIINQYRGRSKLLSLAESCKTSKTFMMSINRGLQKIGVEPFIGLTTYAARHSWATIAAELDIPKETIAAALGHGGNTVTDIYIAYDRRKVDEANRRVIDYVLYG